VGVRKSRFVSFKADEAAFCVFGNESSAWQQYWEFVADLVLTASECV